MVDIQGYSVHLLARVVHVVLLHVAVEELPVEQTGERIALGVLNDVLVFRQLDGAFDARQDDFRLFKWLSDEIRSTAAQTRDFCRTLRGEHDEGDVLQIRIFPHDLH